MIHHSSLVPGVRRCHGSHTQQCLQRCAQPCKHFTRNERCCGYPRVAGRAGILRVCKSGFVKNTSIFVCFYEFFFYFLTALGTAGLLAFGGEAQSRGCWRRSGCVGWLGGWGGWRLFCLGWLWLGRLMYLTCLLCLLACWVVGLVATYIYIYIQTYSTSAINTYYTEAQGGGQPNQKSVEEEH